MWLVHSCAYVDESTLLIHLGVISTYVRRPDELHKGNFLKSRVGPQLIMRKKLLLVQKVSSSNFLKSRVGPQLIMRAEVHLRVDAYTVHYGAPVLRHFEHYLSF